MTWFWGGDPRASPPPRLYHTLMMHCLLLFVDVVSNMLLTTAILMYMYCIIYMHAGRDWSKQPFTYTCSISLTSNEYSGTPIIQTPLGLVLTNKLSTFGDLHVQLRSLRNGGYNQYAWFSSYMPTFQIKLTHV